MHAGGRAGGATPPDGRSGGAAVPIPGARGEVDPRWAAVVQSASLAESASVDLGDSLHDGLFSTSQSLARRAGAEHGYGYGSLGHGHGAWLSSSPYVSSMRGGGLAASVPRSAAMPRSASLQRQASFGSGMLSPTQERDERGEPPGSPEPPGDAPAADLEAGGAQQLASPRTSLDLSRGGARPQRWHLGRVPSEGGAELAEPLLSEAFSERAASATTVAAAAFAAALEPAKSPPPAGSSEAAVALVPVARDVTGADRGETDLNRALVFGFINSVATIPSLVAYANVVFKDPTYTPYIDQLCKFFFLSSAVHQTVFCLLSTLPFSVGQVQDVGLIFLSAMATSIAGACLAAGLDAATALGTSLLTMSVATFVTGLLTLVVAKQKLAQLVQYLPLPVIGGYLSFVGYFCIASGIGLGTSLDIGSLGSWAALASWDAAAKLVPTLASCAAMILTLEHFSHPLALPAVLAAINLLFHAARLALGVTMEQAMDAQWVIRPAAGTQKFWELWALFNIKDWSLDGIYWPALADQWVKVLGLAMVVIFGSAMDIAAIQQDTPTKIDFNRELMTVAVSNMATGASGCGYTGSYIFSQTIFTMRAGVYSRWNGWVVAAAEYVMFALPFPVIQWMPCFFFGSLLLWFGIEISRDWLVLSFTKMTRIEYGLLIATFASIMQWGLEGGIFAGIVLATLYFALAYAKSQVAAIQVAASARSSVVRTLEQAAALDVLGRRLATVGLNGFVFFGSANTIGLRLQEEAERLGGGRDGGAAGGDEGAAAEEALAHSLRAVGGELSGAKHTQAAAALAAAPAYLVLDFAHVRGLDATGARTMGVVYSDLAQHGVTLVVTGAEHHGIRPLLRAHGLPLPEQGAHWPLELAQPAAAEGSVHGSLAGSVTSTPLARTPDRSPRRGSVDGAWDDAQALAAFDDSVRAGCLEFGTLEQGLRYCEDQLLEVAVRYGLCAPPSALLPLDAMLRSHLDKLPLSGGLDPGAAAATLRRYMSAVSVSAGQLLWRVDDPADEMYVIEKGAVRVDEFVHREGEGGEPGSPGGGAPPRPRPAASASAGSLPDRSGSGRRVLSRSFELGPGCVVGSTDFYLARPHQTRAVCRSAVARVLRISRSAMERLAAEAPQALNVLQVAVMRANTLDLSQAADQVQVAA